MKVVKFNPKEGYPVGRKLFYMCKTCGVTIPSQPSHSAGCKCRNVFIDIDYARVAVKRDEDVELLEAET
jgi:hypothetical protein